MSLMTLILVKAAYDDDAEVWYVESSDLEGLNVEARTVEDFAHQVTLAAQDLLEASDTGAFDVPIEIIAHKSTRVRSPALA